MEEENNQVHHEHAPKKDRLLPVSIFVAAVLIAGAVIFATIYKGNQAAPAAPATTGDTTPTVATGTIMQLGSRDAIWGSPNASITIVEYGDYQCPFCGEFFSDTQPLLSSNYISKGTVNMVFRDFPFLGPESTAAAEAAQCAEDQNQLWAYHDALYKAKVGDDEKGGNENDGFFTQALFISLAQQLRLDVPTFTKCVQTNQDAAIVTAEKSNGSADGIDSTPTFFINGFEIMGAQPFSDFQAVIDPMLSS